MDGVGGWGGVGVGGLFPETIAGRPNPDLQNYCQKSKTWLPLHLFIFFVACLRCCVEMVAKESRRV